MDAVEQTSSQAWTAPARWVVANHLVVASRPWPQWVHPQRAEKDLPPPFYWKKSVLEGWQYSPGCLASPSPPLWPLRWHLFLKRYKYYFCFGEVNSHKLICFRFQVFCPPPTMLAKGSSLFVSLDLTIHKFGQVEKLVMLMMITPLLGQLTRRFTSPYMIPCTNTVHSSHLFVVPSLTKVCSPGILHCGPSLLGWLPRIGQRDAITINIQESL